MRRLVFEPGDTDRRYYICYQALCFAPGKMEGRDDLWTLTDVAKKLREIGLVSNPDRGPNDKPLYICPQGGTVTVTEPEYQMLKRFLVAFIENITRQLAEDLRAAIEWIDHVAESATVAKTAAPATSEPSATT